MPAASTHADRHGTIGVVRVATDVIAWIAALAALRAEGVYGLVRPGREGTDNVLGRSHVHRGVSVTMETDIDLSLALWIVLDAGKNAQEVARLVQSNVSDMVERMLGLHVVRVDVTVAHVAYP